MTTSRYYLGIMTGTSLDGIDVALIREEGERYRYLAHHEQPMPPALRAALQALCQPGDNELHRAALEFMIDERNARSETQPERNQHDRDERVYAQLRNHDDHDDNRHDKGNDERQTGHVNTPYI